MTPATVRLSVADAAARLGISTDTVRRKLKRGQLQAKRDNQGQWWIEVPADAKPAEPSTTVEFAHRLRVDAVASDSAWPRLDGCAATATSQRDDRALCRRHVAGR